MFHFHYTKCNPNSYWKAYLDFTSKFVIPMPCKSCITSFQDVRKLLGTRYWAYSTTLQKVMSFPPSFTSRDVSIEKFSQVGDLGLSHPLWPWLNWGTLFVARTTTIWMTWDTWLVTLQLVSLFNFSYNIEFVHTSDIESLNNLQLKYANKTFSYR